MPRTLPLSVCFIMAVVVFTAVFTASLWSTLETAAVSSVGDIASVLQSNIMHDLDHRLQSVLARMLLLLTGLRTIPELERLSPAQIEAYAYDIMATAPDLSVMSLTRPNGELSGAIVLPTGSVGVMYRPASTGDSLENITYWAGNSSSPMYLTTTFEARQRPWYRAAVGAQGPVFTYSFRSVL
eukprot:RCo052296